MKTKNILILLGILIPAYAVLTPRAGVVSGFRDAVSDAKSIYGDDNRIDYYNASAETMALADSVVSFWKSAKLTDQGANFKLATRTLGEAKNLCAGEAFREQNVGAFCSGSLVGDDLVMTAGHCITDAASCADARIVFGHKVTKAGRAGISTVAKGEVYSCSSIVARKLEEGKLGSDYALIKLDRKVSGHKPLAINRSGSIAKGTKLMVIGHPSGLPLKIAAGATVRDASKPEYFVCDLDTFGGNSGSPVFNNVTKKIEGILVRGDEDYSPTPAGCNVATKYAQNGGRGEDVTKISQVSSFIPMRAGEKAAPEVVDMTFTAPEGGAPVPAPVPANPFGN